MSFFACIGHYEKFTIVGKKFFTKVFAKEEGEALFEKSASPRVFLFAEKTKEFFRMLLQFFVK